jgi:hypothetical protein
MSGLTFTVKKKKSSLMPKIRKAFDDDYEVQAGIFREAGKHDNSDESVAQIAAYNEFGTPKSPERPAFRTSFFKNRKKYLKMLKAIARAGFKGRKLKQNAFDMVGLEAKTDIEKSISSGNWAPNAESTQLRKGKGKQLVNDPLIDTGQMLDSVDYKVKKK